MLGEIYGSGCPLGYILIQSAPRSAQGGKQRYLEDLLKHFKGTWNIQAKVTLTDKDLSEINAFRAIYPEAKHQLCFWHCLRALKKRLSILRRGPAFYNVDEAKREFEFVDITFVPRGQSKERNPVSDQCE